LRILLYVCDAKKISKFAQNTSYTSQIPEFFAKELPACKITLLTATNEAILTGEIEGKVYANQEYFVYM
jgi:hypothetical protein